MCCSRRWPRKKPVSSLRRRTSVSQTPPAWCRPWSTAPTATAVLVVEYPEGTTVDCSGVDLTDYPGGVYNVFHATAGNKVLVAWPSRFCQQGQPAYSFAWDGDDEGLTEDQLAQAQAVVASCSASTSPRTCT